MTPKIIHYCWFGRNTLPESARKCIASWHKYLPDYEIKEWNEDNFDVNIIPYTQQAYDAKKYAFVSDYARFWILYHYGGLYFDTDVEIIQSMDGIIQRGPFMGCEKLVGGRDDITAVVPGRDIGVNPGLGIGADSGLELYKMLLEKYSKLQFLMEDGSLNQKTIVSYTTELLLELGLQNIKEIQEVAGVWIYPSEFFCPMDHTTGITTITPHTVSIHHYDASWCNHHSWRYRIHLVKNFVFRLLGPKAANTINRILHNNHCKSC